MADDIYAKIEYQVNDNGYWNELKNAFASLVGLQDSYSYNNSRYYHLSSIYEGPISDGIQYQFQMDIEYITDPNASGPPASIEPVVETFSVSEPLSFKFRYAKFSNYTAGPATASVIMDFKNLSYLNINEREGNYSINHGQMINPALEDESFSLSENSVEGDRSMVHAFKKFENADDEYNVHFSLKGLEYNEGEDESTFIDVPTFNNLEWAIVNSPDYDALLEDIADTSSRARLITEMENYINFQILTWNNFENKHGHNNVISLSPSGESFTDRGGNPLDYAIVFVREKAKPADNIIASKSDAIKLNFSEPLF